VSQVIILGLQARNDILFLFFTNCANQM